MSLQENIDRNCLPYANSDFSDIRKQNLIYVDKTRIIAELASRRAPQLFLRPRRFGKTLLTSTLHSLFANGLEDFQGLEIEKLWDDKKYKVVHLDFSSMADNTPEEFKHSLGEKLIEEFNVQGKVDLSDPLGVRSPSMILYEIIDDLENCSVVLLIDEYDAPFIHHTSNPDEQKKIASILYSFYAVVKQYTGRFRFILLTGVNRTIQVSIFSGFNNLLDMSLREEFNTLLGFTRDELTRYFDPYIADAARVLGMDIDDVYQNIEKYYGGFKFTLHDSEYVYNPWSVLSFLKRPEDGFRNYWLDFDETPVNITHYLKENNDFDIEKYSKKGIYINRDKILGIYDVNGTPLYIYLYLAGYLSIHDNGGTNYLSIPNAEVKERLLSLFPKANKPIE